MPQVIHLIHVIEALRDIGGSRNERIIGKSFLTKREAFGIIGFLKELKEQE